MNIPGHEFREVWAVDFEFAAPPGDPPTPLCMVAKELVSGRVLRLWQNDLRQLDRAPFDTSPSSVMIAYYASAELGCFHRLGWPFPANVLDLYAEFRNATNGKLTPNGWGLLGSLSYYGLDGVSVADKDSMRLLALRGGSYTDAERVGLLDYCESDVVGVEKLFQRMQVELDVDRALLRGRYMAAVARIEQTGTPIDVERLEGLRTHWAGLQDKLVERIDADYGVFDGRTFKADRWAAWLTANNTPWPRLTSGALALDDDTFREMSRAYPSVAAIRELRVSLSQLRLESLAVGADGRNRCLLSTFRSKTGRNQPSNSAFIFGPSVWLRGLIRPGLGRAVAYIDWSQQEFGVAAALSGDPAMLAAYESGDPYLAFAKQAGIVPADGTRETHSAQRELCKVCVLGTGYGMGPDTLASRIGQPPIVARELLRKHRETYRRFWGWSDGAVDHAMLCGSLHTVFGWTIHTGPNTNPRSLANFPMQANGAEMLRLACIFATERGVSVCAPVHDAVLVEGAAERISDVVDAAKTAMSDASAAVLGGFRLRTDAKVFAWPERYSDPRGQRMWDVVQGLLAELKADPTCAATNTPTCAATNTVPVRQLTHRPSYSSLLSVGFLNEYPTPRPEAASITATETVDPQKIESPPAAQAGFALSEGADSVGLAPGCGNGRGSHQGLSRGDCSLVSGGRETVQLGDPISFDPSTFGGIKVFSSRRLEGIGAGGLGASDSEAGVLAGGDDIGLPDWAFVRIPPELPPDWAEEWLERAAIREFEGLQDREGAERDALSEILELLAFRKANSDLAGCGCAGGVLLGA